MRAIQFHNGPLKEQLPELIFQHSLTINDLPITMAVDSWNWQDVAEDFIVQVVVNTAMSDLGDYSNRIKPIFNSETDHITFYLEEEQHVLID